MIGPREAAQLILQDYQGALAVMETISIRGCQAAIAVGSDQHPILLVRGSDEPLDWLYNMMVEHVLDDGDSGAWYHKGFLHHARIVYAFAKGKALTGVIGHSLGAAVTQIVAPSLGLPGIGIAPPRPLWAPDATFPRPAAERITLYCRVDDLVCFLPTDDIRCLIRALLHHDDLETVFARPGRYVHLAGQVVWLRPPQHHVGADHSIMQYLPLLPDHQPVLADGAAT